MWEGVLISGEKNYMIALKNILCFHFWFLSSGFCIWSQGRVLPCPIPQSKWEPIIIKIQGFEDSIEENNVSMVRFVGRIFGDILQRIVEDQGVELMREVKIHFSVGSYRAWWGAHCLFGRFPTFFTCSDKLFHPKLIYCEV